MPPRNKDTISGSSADEALHEFNVLKQWHATVMAPNPLRHVRATSFPLTMLEWIERVPLWKLAVNPAHGLVAVVKQGGELEIRSVHEPDTVITTTKLLSDANSDWCRFEWSSSSLLMYFARSTPVIDVMDGAGSYCYSIPLEGDMDVSFDPLLAVCAMESVVQSNESKWSDQLYVLQYCAMLRVFYTGRLSGYHPCYSVDLSLISSGLDFASQLNVCFDQSLIYITVQYPKLKEDDWLTVPSMLDAPRLGVLQLRLVNQPPYAILTQASEQAAKNMDKPDSMMTRFASCLPCCAAIGKCVIVDTHVNTDHTRLAAVSSLGDLFVFELPSLQLLAAIESQSLIQKTETDVIDVRPLMVRWWTESELMMLKFDGSLCVVGLEKDRTNNEQNLLDALKHDQLSNKRVTASTSMLVPDVGLCYLFEVILQSITQHGADEIVTTPSKLRLAVQLVGVTCYGWIKVLIGATVGRPATEVGLPTADTVACRQVQFRLCEMRLTTPEEMFRKLLDSESYEDALSLAASYDLDADQVHKRRWTAAVANGIDKDVIDNCLCQVKDLRFVVDECATRVPRDASTIRRLLATALKRTKQQLLINNTADMDENRIHDLLRAHCRLLHYVTSLNNYVRLCHIQHTTFNADQYQKLRRYSLLECAIHFAQTCQFDWLLSVCCMHRDLLAPYWLCLVSVVPEVVDVESYKMLLPNMTNGHAVLCEAIDLSAAAVPDSQSVDGWMDADDDDSDVIGNSADPLADESFTDVRLQLWLQEERTLYRTRSNTLHSDPELASFLMPAASSSVSDHTTRWLRWRVTQIATRTGVPDLLVAFLSVLVQRGFQDFEKARDDARMFAEFVYDVSDTTRGFDEFVATDCSYLVDLWMTELRNKYSLDELIKRGLLERVLPFLEHSARHARCQPKLVFQQYVISQSKDNLKFPLKLLHHVKRAENLVTVKRVLDYGNEDWVALVDACLSACQLSGEQMAEAGSKLVATLPVSPKEECSGSKLTTINAHLDALSMLDGYEVAYTWAQLTHALNNSAFAQQLINKIIRRPKPSTWSLHSWQQLYSDMCQLCSRVLHNVSLATCKTVFVSALLASADPVGIQYATQFMTLEPESDNATTDDEVTSPLPYPVSLSLIVQAAVDYINQAQDAKDPSLKFAQQCLIMVDGEIAEVQCELDLLAALPLLDKLGVKQLPLKIRMISDKMQVLNWAISTGKNYQSHKPLVQLANLLHVEQAKARVLHACATTAIQHEDTKFAFLLCNDLVHINYVPAWPICYALCSSGLLAAWASHDDFAREFELWAFALLHCDGNQMESIQQEMNERRAEVIALQNALVGRKVEDIKRHVSKVVEHDWSPSRICPPHYLYNDDRINSITTKTDDPSQPEAWMSESESYQLTAAILSWMSANQSITDHELICWSLGQFARSCDTAELRLSALMQMPDRTVQDISACFDGLHSSDKQVHKQATNMWRYVCALVIVRRLHLCQDLGQLASYTPEQLVAYVLNADWSELDERQTQSIADWLDALRSTQNAVKVDSQLRQVLSKFPDVNPERFVSEDEYRSDTIVGMAMTHDTEAFNVALKMANEYGLDEWTLRMTNLTYLLVDSGLPASSVQNSVRRHGLIEYLIKDRKRLTSELCEQVQPLLNGRDHQLLAVYYLILHKINSKNSVGESAQRHRAAVRQLSKTMPDVDYYFLLNCPSTDRLVAFTYPKLLNAEKALGFGGLWSAVPDLKFDYNLSEFCVAFARRLFNDRLDSSSDAEDAVQVCSLLLDQLDDVQMLAFVNQLELHDMLSDERDSIVRALIGYTGQNRERLPQSWQLCQKLKTDIAVVQPASQVQIVTPDPGPVVAAVNEIKRISQPETLSPAVEKSEQLSDDEPVKVSSTVPEKPSKPTTNVEKKVRPTKKVGSRPKPVKMDTTEITGLHVKSESTSSFAPLAPNPQRQPPVLHSTDNQSPADKHVLQQTSSDSTTSAGTGLLSSWFGLTSEPESSLGGLKLYRQDAEQQQQPEQQHQHKQQQQQATSSWGAFDYGAIFSAVKQQIAPPVDEEPDNKTKVDAPKPETIPSTTHRPSIDRSSPRPSVEDVTGGGLVHRRKR